MFFVPTRTKIEPSALSAALQPSDFQTPPEWKRVTTFSPGRQISPHFIFHSAMHQIRELELNWEPGRFTPAAQRASAKRVLKLWQQGQTDDAADAYIRALDEVAFRSESRGTTTEEKDLP